MALKFQVRSIQQFLRLEEYFSTFKVATETWQPFMFSSQIGHTFIKMYIFSNKMKVKFHCFVLNLKFDKM